MPKLYEKMRNQYAKSMSLKAAKKKAVMSYNAQRGDKPPVTRASK